MPRRKESRDKAVDEIAVGDSLMYEGLGPFRVVLVQVPAGASRSYRIEMVARDGTQLMMLRGPNDRLTIG